VRRAEFCLQFLNLGLALMLSFSAALAQTVNEAQKPEAEPFGLCGPGSQQIELPSAWQGKANSRHHAWDCGTNSQNGYVEELSLQLFLNVAGDKGVFQCGTSRITTVPAPPGVPTTVGIGSARTAVITRATVNGSRYVLRVIFCDDHAESCDLRGRKMADSIAGSYVCHRAGKQIDDGTWTVEPKRKPTEGPKQML
jgi:hypothetical protein